MIVNHFHSEKTLTKALNKLIQSWVSLLAQDKNVKISCHPLLMSINIFVKTKSTGGLIWNDLSNPFLTAVEVIISEFYTFFWIMASTSYPGRRSHGGDGGEMGDVVPFLKKGRQWGMSTSGAISLILIAFVLCFDSNCLHCLIRSLLTRRC